MWRRIGRWWGISAGFEDSRQFPASDGVTGLDAVIAVAKRADDFNAIAGRADSHMLRIFPAMKLNLIPEAREKGF
jgi:hypothetical protein